LDPHLGSGAVRLRFGVHPNLGKRVRCHRSPPQTSNEPEGFELCDVCPRARDYKDEFAAA
jgi:hypothetical protein